VSASRLVEQVLASGLVQPDQTTCGSCVLVVARLLNDPSYAEQLVDGADPAAGDETSARIQDRFGQEALDVHRVTSRLRDGRGGGQVPWPRALGTSPWALAREMTAHAGRPGRRYHARLILPGEQSRTFARVVTLAGAGHAVPLYVGDRWSPRHVVLVLPSSDVPSDHVRIYDPATGRRYLVDGGDFSARTLDVAGWHSPWVVVVPT
jgi:hypothetical protein